MQKRRALPRMDILKKFYCTWLPVLHSPHKKVREQSVLLVNLLQQKIDKLSAPEITTSKTKLVKIRCKP